MKTRVTRRIAPVVLSAALVVGAGMLGTARADENGMKASYKVGEGLKIGDGKNQIQLQGRVQGRFTYNALEGTVDNDTFAIQRGKIKIEGFTLDKKLKFGFQMDLATRNRATTAAVCTDGAGADVDATGECTQANTNAITAESTTGLATLDDYYVDYVPADYFGIKVGQFKVPFLMQFLTSSAKLQFVDRSLSTGFFNLGRDIGITFHGGFLEDNFNYNVFAMNGDGGNTINRNQSLMVGTRVEHAILGKYKPSDSDVDDSQEPNLGWGLAAAFNDLGSAIQGGTIAAGTKTLNGTLDVGYKYKGWSVQGAGMISRALDTAKLTNWGYNAQVGWFIVPKQFEVAARGAGAIFSGAVVNQYEYNLGLNYLIKGDGIKLQTDYALLLSTRGLNLNDHRVRTQLQVTF